LEEAFTHGEFSFEINKPYDPKDGMINAMDMMTAYNFPHLIEGVMIEVRNDFAVDPDYRQRLIKAIMPVLKKLNEENVESNKI